VEQDQRALAVILAARPEKEYVSQAADILKKLIEDQEARQSPSYQDKFMLAQIYRRRNDWNNYTPQCLASWDKPQDSQITSATCKTTMTL
jgi:hypothetical protein